MKLLHNNKREFIRSISIVSDTLRIDAGIVEKDYYVFMLLKLIRMHDDEIMFKGGTSLSKAWGILPRFSEDIDLNLLPEVPSTDSHRQKFARSVYNALTDMGFNYDYSKIASRREYNTFEQPYNALFKNNVLNKNIMIETMANKKGKILNATYTPRLISNYIWDAFSTNPKVADTLRQYSLDPFIVNTQNMDVTFVEKVMSLTNRYLKNESYRLSRHLYDIYYMWTFGNLSSFNLRQTMLETKSHLLERTNDICLRQDVPAYTILLDALRCDFYKYDFNNVTAGMKFQQDNITYEMCRDLLVNIVTNRVGEF